MKTNATRCRNIKILTFLFLLYSIVFIPVISNGHYTAEKDKFCLPEVLPQRVQLGENCRAMLLNLKMRYGVELKSITLETLSQEVVVGLMGISIMKL